MVPEHLREAGLYGAFFLALAAAQLAYAGAVLARPSRALLVAGAVASALVVALWLQTRLVGVPLGPGAGEREPFGLLDLLCAAAEAATAGAALVAARVRLSAPARP